jgi:Tfp pilus assembly protein PilN
MIFDVNLVAPAHTRRAGLSLLTPPAAAAAVVFIGLAVWTCVLTAHVNAVRRDLSRATEQISALRPAASHAQTLQRSEQQMRRRQALVQQLLTAQLPAPRVLQAIRTIVPENMSLTGVTAGASEVVFDGYTLSYPSLARFMVALENSGLVRRATLTSSHREDLSGTEVVKFRVTGDLPPVRTATASGAVP